MRAGLLSIALALGGCSGAPDGIVLTDARLTVWGAADAVQRFTAEQAVPAVRLPATEPGQARAMLTLTGNGQDVIRITRQALAADLSYSVTGKTS